MTVLGPSDVFEIARRRDARQCVGGASKRGACMTEPILIVGYAAAALTTLAFLPQVVKTWRSGSARELSLATLALMTTGVALWLGYGLATGDGPLAAANGVTLALVASLLALKLRDLGRREPPSPAALDA